MQKIKSKDILLYATMPRVFPRIKGLVSSGFSYVAYLMAQIYCMARLLPQSHPYLIAGNIGRYGVRHVLAEASRHLTFSRKNIDQIIIYFAMLAGIVMILAQIVMLVYSVLIQPAMAGPLVFNSWFDTADPTNDIAFSLLDRVFGIPNMFCSSVGVCTAYSLDTSGAGGPPIPLPFHIALQGLFRFYSMGLLLIAVLLFLYFVVVVVVETTVTGTPFGQRFKNVWVPIRLVVAVLLLLPIDYGLNSGQYVVLYAAKYGSGLATNGWLEFNDEVQSHPVFAGLGASRPGGERYSMVAIPEGPDMTPVVEAMSLVHSCAYAYHRLNAGKQNINNSSATYPDKDANYTEGSSTLGRYQIQPFLVKQPIGSMSGGETLYSSGGVSITGDNSPRILIPNETSVTYLDALGFYYAGDIIIRFGEYRHVDGDTSRAVYNVSGNVKSLCGDIRIPVGNLSDPGGATAGRGGADHMLRFYYNLILSMWFTEPEFRQFARGSVEHSLNDTQNSLNAFCTGTESTGGSASLSGTGAPGFYSAVADCEDNPPPDGWKQRQIARFTVEMETAVMNAWRNYVNNSVYSNLSADTLSRGWGGAGIWYNKIAEINGGWIDGVDAVPKMSTYPLVMEQIQKENKQNSGDGGNPYNPNLSTPSQSEAPTRVQVGQGDAVLQGVGVPLSEVYDYWNKGLKDADLENRNLTDNPFIATMQLFLGTDGMFAIRGANQHLHPLAQLVAVGKSLVDSAIVNVLVATGAGAMDAALKKILGAGSDLAGIGDAIGKAAFAMAFVGLTAGFVLYYVLPFLPFLYFYFAVASWVKAIFEAMVGAPLWALAHLRIDGEGLPGEAAQNGYFLVLEIFVRPILTVFGLLAAILIFSTQVRVMNMIWELVTSNAAGFTTQPDILGDPTTADDRYFQRGIVDQFFFTVVYTIVCYMLALSSFKLIDKIPDNILRWAGAGVSAFGDIDQDNIESLNRYAAMGGMTVGNQAAGAVVEAGKGIGGIAGDLTKSTFGRGKPRAPGP